MGQQSIMVTPTSNSPVQHPNIATTSGMGTAFPMASYSTGTQRATTLPPLRQLQQKKSPGGIMQDQGPPSYEAATAYPPPSYVVFSQQQGRVPAPAYPLSGTAYPPQQQQQQQQQLHQRPHSAILLPLQGVPTSPYPGAVDPLPQHSPSAYPVSPTQDQQQPSAPYPIASQQQQQRQQEQPLSIPYPSTHQERPHSAPYFSPEHHPSRPSTAYFSPENCPSTPSQDPSPPEENIAL